MSGPRSNLPKLAYPCPVRRISLLQIGKGNHDEIKRLWVDENKTLPETNDGHGLKTLNLSPRKFNSAMKAWTNSLLKVYSIEQYKKQLKKWNWSKYLPTKEAFWMDNKLLRGSMKRRGHGLRLPWPDIHTAIHPATPSEKEDTTG